MTSSIHKLSPDDGAIVANQLVAIVGQNPGSTVQELSTALNLHKKAVNPVLYGDKRFVKVEKEGQSQPIWYLADALPEGVVAVKTSRGTTSTGSTSSEETFVLTAEDIERFKQEALEFEAKVLERFVRKSDSPRPQPAVTSPSEDNPFALYEWQKEALLNWQKQGFRGIVDAVTGAGKTRLAVAAIADELERGGQVLVLVPTIVLLHQWEGILTSFFPSAAIGLVGDGNDDEFSHSNILVAVLASARTRKLAPSGDHGLLVADECHRAAADENRKALRPEFQHRLGLSATHERLDDAHIEYLLPYFGQVVHTLSYGRAIDDGVVSTVRVAFVGVDFSDEEIAQYLQITRTMKKMRDRLVSEFGCRANPFNAFFEDVLRIMQSGGMKAGMAAHKWMKCWTEKKALLSESPAKANAVSTLAGAMRDASRTLVFTQSIASADLITEQLLRVGINAKSHHSAIDPKDRQIIMEEFENGTTSVLVTVQTLEEGIDVPEADLAIIVASSKQRRQMVQRMGRILRRKDDGRDGRFVLLFATGTDEDPIKGAHEHFVDELLDVAHESTVAHISQSDEIRAFLNPDRR
jgi:superfamily II DNA or RNA helicase